MYSSLALLQSPYVPSTTSYNEIIPNLYIGNYESLKNATKFKMIVNCTKHIPFPITINIDHVRVAIHDHEDQSAELLQYAPNVIDKIHDMLQKNKPVLVHCHAGMQRSCAVVAMYLMKYYKIKPSDAIRFIQSRRSIAFQPKPTFDRALQVYYQDMNSI
jgi:hypothetical protein